jgi:hypothetical protein
MLKFAHSIPTGLLSLILATTRVADSALLARSHDKIRNAITEATFMKLLPGIRKLYRALHKGCVSAASIDQHTLRDIGADPMRIHFKVDKSTASREQQELWRQAC